MSLRTKLMLFLLPLAVVSVVMATVFSRRAAESVVSQEVIQRGFAMAAGLAHSSETIEGFRTGSERVLLRSLQSAIEGTEALYAFALDFDGRVLSHTNVAEKGRQYQGPIASRGPSGDEPIHHRFREEGRDVLGILYPVWEVRREDSGEAFLLLGESGGESRQRVGTVGLGLPLQGALDTSHKISRQLFWIVTVIGGVALGVVLVFLRKILAPIRFLVGATKRLGRGELARPFLNSHRARSGNSLAASTA